MVVPGGQYRGATGEYVDAEYRFEILDGVSHWCPKKRRTR
jgi:hypothetical protein